MTSCKCVVICVTSCLFVGIYTSIRRPVQPRERSKNKELLFVTPSTAPASTNTPENARESTSRRGLTRFSKIQLGIEREGGEGAGGRGEYRIAAENLC